MKRKQGEPVGVDGVLMYYGLNDKIINRHVPVSVVEKKIKGN